MGGARGERGVASAGQPPGAGIQHPPDQEQREQGRDRPEEQWQVVYTKKISTRLSSRISQRRDGFYNGVGRAADAHRGPDRHLFLLPRVQRHPRESGPQEAHDNSVCLAQHFNRYPKCINNSFIHQYE